RNVQRIDGITTVVERFDNVADAEDNADTSPPIEPTQGVEIAVQRQAGDDPERHGIPKRRAIAMKIRQDVQAASESGTFDFPKVHNTLADVTVMIDARFAPRPMPANDMIQ